MTLSNKELEEAIYAAFQMIRQADPQGQLKVDVTKHFHALLDVQLSRAKTCATKGECHET